MLIVDRQLGGATASLAFHKEEKQGETACLALFKERTFPTNISTAWQLTQIKM